MTVLKSSSWRVHTRTDAYKSIIRRAEMLSAVHYILERQIVAWFSLEFIHLEFHWWFDFCWIKNYFCHVVILVKKMSWVMVKNSNFFLIKVLMLSKYIISELIWSCTVFTMAWKQESVLFHGVKIKNKGIIFFCCENINISHKSWSVFFLLFIISFSHIYIKEMPILWLRWFFEDRIWDIHFVLLESYVT